MSWLSLILCSALMLSLYDLCKKKSVNANSVFPVLFISTACGFAMVVAMLAVAGRLQSVIAMPLGLVALLGVKAALVGASWTFSYWALKTLPVTIVAPIRATGPIWTFLAALVVFFPDEVPSPFQLLGLVCAFAGCIAFSLAGKAEGLTFRNKAVLFIIAGTLTGSCSALYDKCLLHELHLPPDAVLFWFMGGMTVIYAVACAVYNGMKFERTKFEWRLSIPLVGILLAISDWLYFTSIADPDARISIVSTLRRSSTVVTFVVGGALFHETNLLRKGLATAAILAGVVILCLAS